MMIGSDVEIARTSLDRTASSRSASVRWTGYTRIRRGPTPASRQRHAAVGQDLARIVVTVPSLVSLDGWSEDELNPE